ncbi:secreted protein containing DUF1566, partial [Candidatus Magnetobacterium bavaricum]
MLMKANVGVSNFRSWINGWRFVLMAILIICSQRIVAAGGEIQNTSASPLWQVVDTNQSKCYNGTSEITCPVSGGSFYGQDAQYTSVVPSYKNNGDGTITDLKTGLMWQKTPGTKKTWTEASNGAATLNLGGYTDWRLPSIKELYSLIEFSGTDPSGYNGTDTSTLIPFLDTKYFDFQYGDTSAGERIIDAQYTSSTKYVSTTMSGAETAFGVNFADGRIKGYGLINPSNNQATTFLVRYVRGNPGYAINSFVDNGDNTV